MNKIVIQSCVVLYFLFFLTGCLPFEKEVLNEKEVAILTAGKEYDENYGSYKTGEDINSNPMIQLGIEKLGIQMKYTIIGTGTDDYINKIRLGLSGAGELPSIIPVYDQGLLSEMIDSGRVKGISQDLEKEMPERLKKLYETYEDTFYPVERDDEIYGLAISPSLAETQVMYIRQDWLDKLDLKAPTNLSEFETVIKAFSEDDPDGNRSRDTYGFSYSGNGIYSTGWLGDPAMLFSSKSGKYIPGNWDITEENQLFYGSLHPGNRDILEKMSVWHKEEWLIPEAGIINDWGALEKFREGQVGIVIGRAFYHTAASEVKEKIPGAIVKAYPTIQQDNGEPTYQRAEINDGWFLFNKDFDNMNLFFEYYDWLYDIAFGTGDFQYGYLENYDYDIVNNQVTFDPLNFDPIPKDKIFNPTKAILTKNRPYLDRMAPYYEVYNGKEPSTGFEIQIAEDVQQRAGLVHAYNLAYEMQNRLSENKFKGPQSETMKKEWYKLTLLEAETYTDIIYGKKPIIAFDEFVEKWYQDGGELITEEVNQWYQSILLD